MFFRIRNLSGKFQQETLDFFLLKTEVDFKNISLVYYRVYLNDPFGNNLCLKKL
jgi:hypothetical protein